MTALSEGENFLKRYEEFSDLHAHDYGAPLGFPLPLAGLDDELAERIGRLCGVAMKDDVAKPVKIDPALSNTGSSFAYKFLEERLKDPAFSSSEEGKPWVALLSATEALPAEAEKGAYLPPEHGLPMDRVAYFAIDLGSEGRTFLAILAVVRWPVCRGSLRGALLEVLNQAAVAAGGLTAASSVAGLLAAHIPLLALCPPLVLTAVVTLIVAMGVEAFCPWSERMLAQQRRITDSTGEGIDNG